MEYGSFRAEEFGDLVHHTGEEFIYVLEGVLTLVLDGERQELCPGDSAHYPSSLPHNWGNLTNKCVRFLVVSHPNPH